MKAIAMVLALLSVSVSCGGVTRNDVKVAKRDLAWARTELENAGDSAAAIGEYTLGLESGKLEPGTYLLFTAADIKAYGAKAYLPYQFPAKSFHKKITGTFRTEKILDVEILHSNRLKMTLLLKGEKIEVHYKGDLYKPHIKKIKAGLKAGLEVELSISLRLDLNKHAIVAKAHCTAVKLRKNNDDLYRSNIRQAINAALSKESYSIPVPAAGAQEAAALLTTKTHVVLIYR